MPRYKKVTASEKGGWSEWQFPIMSGYKMACCDCGLVHEMEFMVVKDELGEPIDGRVLMRARRNERATGQVRRRMKKEEDSE